MKFYDFFAYVYFTILGACLICGLLSWKKARKPFRLLAVLIGLTLVVEIVARWMLHLFGENNFVYIFYDFLNVGLISLMLIELSRSKLHRAMMRLAASLLAAYYLVDVIFFGQYTAHYSILNCVISIFFCLLSCIYLLDLIQHPMEEGLMTMPEFVFVMLLLFFYSISVLYWILFLRFAQQEVRGITTLMFRFFLISNLIFYSGICWVFRLELKRHGRIYER